SVTLANTVLCSMDDDDLGVPLRYWDSRTAELITADELVETWGSKPLAFTGQRASDVVNGRWIVIDDERQQSYLAIELIAAARSLVHNRIGDDGYPYPRVVCYRDPKGRLLMTRMHNMVEDDRHRNGIAE